MLVRNVGKAMKQAEEERTEILCRKIYIAAKVYVDVIVGLTGVTTIMKARKYGEIAANEAHVRDDTERQIFIAEFLYMVTELMKGDVV